MKRNTSFASVSEQRQLILASGPSEMLACSSQFSSLHLKKIKKLIAHSNRCNFKNEKPNSHQHHTN
jgi:hypothetical protein